MRTEQLEELYGDPPEGKCIVCGLTLSVNPHPQAGKPEMMNTIGTVFDCLPCANKRARGRADVISGLRRWLERMAESETTMIEVGRVLEKLNDMDEERRKAYHDHSAIRDQKE